MVTSETPVSSNGGKVMTWVNKNCSLSYTVICHRGKLDYNWTIHYRLPFPRQLDDLPVLSILITWLVLLGNRMVFWYFKFPFIRMKKNAIYLCELTNTLDSAVLSLCIGYVLNCMLFYFRYSDTRGQGISAGVILRPRPPTPGPHGGTEALGGSPGGAPRAGRGPGLVHRLPGQGRTPLILHGSVVWVFTAWHSAYLWIMLWLAGLSKSPRTFGCKGTPCTEACTHPWHPPRDNSLCREGQTEITFILLLSRHDVWPVGKCCSFLPKLFGYLFQLEDVYTYPTTCCVHGTSGDE